jgi:hypothetical protein
MSTTTRTNLQILSFGSIGFLIAFIGLILLYSLLV